MGRIWIPDEQLMGIKAEFTEREKLIGNINQKRGFPRDGLDGNGKEIAGSLHDDFHYGRHNIVQVLDNNGKTVSLLNVKNDDEGLSRLHDFLSKEIDRPQKTTADYEWTRNYYDSYGNFDKKDGTFKNTGLKDKIKNIISNMKTSQMEKAQMRNVEYGYCSYIESTDSKPELYLATKSKKGEQIFEFFKQMLKEILSFITMKDTPTIKPDNNLHHL